MIIILIRRLFYETYEAHMFVLFTLCANILGIKYKNIWVDLGVQTSSFRFAECLGFLSVSTEKLDQFWLTIN